jgi:DNA-binding response OmpR family regulator
MATVVARFGLIAKNRWRLSWIITRTVRYRGHRTMPTDRSARVLVVDDDPEALEMLSTWLRIHGYSVDTCPDSAQALVLFEARPPDAVLLDLHMPRVSGTEIFSLMHRAQPSIPVIIVTGDGDVELGRILLDCGAFDYALKPVDLDYLGTALAVATARGWERALDEGRPIRDLSYAVLRAVRRADPHWPAREPLEALAFSAVRNALAEHRTKALDALLELRNVLETVTPTDDAPTIEVIMQALAPLRELLR